MKILGIPMLLLAFLAGCDGPSGRSHEQAMADGVKFRGTAEAIIVNTMAINICPPGTRPVRVQIAGGSSAAAINQNGNNGYTMSADSTKTMQCVH